MNVSEETPLDRAQAKREQIERELRKCPDFQLYLLTKSRKERARMGRLLMEIPNFRLWRALSTSIERERRRRQRTPAKVFVARAAREEPPGTNRQIEQLPGD